MKGFLSVRIIVGILCFLLLAGSVYIVAEGIPAYAIEVGYCAVKCELYKSDPAGFAACMDGCLWAVWQGGL